MKHDPLQECLYGLKNGSKVLIAQYVLNKYNTWEPLNTTDVTTANVTTADSTANVSRADKSRANVSTANVSTANVRTPDVLGYELRYGLEFRLGLEVRAGVSNTRPSGRMRPTRRVCAALYRIVEFYYCTPKEIILVYLIKFKDCQFLSSI